MQTLLRSDARRRAETPGPGTGRRFGDPRTDHELLRCHADQRDRGEAFAELVARHGDMVYAAAVRQAGRSGLADDVAQATFLLLSRKAGQIAESVTLAAWLHKATRYAALNAMKMERRRRAHERRAGDALPVSTPVGLLREHVDEAWARGSSLLDEGVARLGPGERDAVVLRFLERRSFAEVGKALEISEQAAQMRVGRALEKLREFFRRRGVLVSAAALRAAIDVHGLTPAPASLKLAMASHAAAGATPAAALDATVDAIAHAAARSMRWEAICTAGGVGVAGLSVSLLLGLAICRIAFGSPVDAPAGPVAKIATTRPAEGRAPSPVAAAKDAPPKWRVGPVVPVAERLDEIFTTPSLVEHAQRVERLPPQAKR